jgi:hypothetical protein
LQAGLRFIVFRHIIRIVPGESHLVGNEATVAQKFVSAVLGKQDATEAEHSVNEAAIHEKMVDNSHIQHSFLVC